MKKQIMKYISRNSKVALIALFALISATLSAQDSSWVRKYQFGIYNQYDLRNSSENAVSINRAVNDGFRRGIKPLMGPKLGNVTYGVFNFATVLIVRIGLNEYVKLSFIIFVDKSKGIRIESITFFREGVPCDLWICDF